MTASGRRMRKLDGECHRLGEVAPPRSRGGTARWTSWASCGVGGASIKAASSPSPESSSAAIHPAAYPSIQPSSHPATHPSIQPSIPPFYYFTLLHPFSSPYLAGLSTYLSPTPTDAANHSSAAGRLIHLVRHTISRPRQRRPSRQTMDARSPGGGHPAGRRRITATDDLSAPGVWEGLSVRTFG